jgi:5-methylthioribose kinase
MYNELRYRAKTHAKSEKLSKERNKVPHLLPNFFFFVEKQQIHAYGKGNDI